MHQVAVAIFNDPATESARASALECFKAGATWGGATQRLLPTVFAELRKPIYEGATWDDTAWTAAAELLAAA
jgi:hypothetical protein